MPGQARVLYVGDTPRFADRLADALDRDADENGVIVAVECDPDAAIGRLRDSDVDCVVSEYDLPNRDGIAFLRRVRDDFPELPFVLTPANGSEAVAARAVAQDVTFYVPRGENGAAIERLAERIESAIARDGPRPRERTQVIDGREARGANLEQYRTIVDHLREAVWMLDEDGRVEFVNEFLADVLGVSSESIVGEPIRSVLEDSEVTLSGEPTATGEGPIDSLVPAEIGEEVRDELRLAVGGEDVVLDVKSVHLDGSDGTGDVVGTAHDVTERRDLETRLRLYERAIEGSTDLFAAIDETYEYLFANETYCEYHDVDPDSVVGRHVESVLDGDLVDSIEEQVERTLDGEAVQYDITRPHPDLGERHLDVRYYPVSDVETSSQVLVAAMRDVTERKRREQRVTALHTAAADIAAADCETDVYRSLVEAATEVLAFDFAIADAERDDRLIPQAMTENLSEGGYYEKTPVDDPDTLAARAFRERETILTDDLRKHDVAPADSEYRSILTVPIGKFGVFQAGSRDVGVFDETDRELTELLVGHAIETLTRMEHERRLRQQREALSRENERLEQFASVVSHDLRNPLTVARGELELARETVDSDHLDEIEISLGRLEAIIEDVLSMARDGRAVGDDERATVALENVARESWEQVSTGDAVLRVESGPSVVADADRLKQVFENLFRNAVDHGLGDVDGSVDRSPALTVRVGALSDDDGFYVEDDGAGIPDSDREDVFRVGYSTAEDGTGFGLKIVEDVVHAHGWQVRLTQSDSGGARFEVTDVELA